MAFADGYLFRSRSDFDRVAATRSNDTKPADPRLPQREKALVRLTSEVQPYDSTDPGATDPTTGTGEIISYHTAGPKTTSRHNGTTLPSGWTVHNIQNRSFWDGQVVLCSMLDGRLTILEALSPSPVHFELNEALAVTDASAAARVVSGYCYGTNFTEGYDITVENAPASTNHIFEGIVGAHGIAWFDGFKYWILQMECPS